MKVFEQILKKTCISVFVISNNSVSILSNMQRNTYYIKDGIHDKILIRSLKFTTLGCDAENLTFNFNLHRNL